MPLKNDQPGSSGEERVHGITSETVTTMANMRRFLQMQVTYAVFDKSAWLVLRIL
jgi:hypothetical protein